MNSLKNNKGIALVITLLVVALLVTMVVEMNYISRIGLALAENRGNLKKAFWLAKSGIAVGKMLLKQDKFESIVDDLNEAWAFPFPPTPIGDGVVKLSITDEERKININEMVRDGKWLNTRMVDMVKRLFLSFDLDENLIDGIIDWLDSDDNPRANGAENSYYNSLDPPYNCKNGQMNSISELKMIYGITPEIFSKIAPYLTVKSSGKININTASFTVLTCLHNEISEGVAEEIIRFREKSPFEALSDLKKVPGITENIYTKIVDLIDIESEYFTIHSTGKVVDAISEITTIGKRKDGYWETVYYRVD